MNQFILSQYKYLLLLIPIALITGPLIPEIIVLFIIGYLFATTILEKKTYIYKSNFFKFLILICSFILVRNYFSDYFFKNYLVSLFYIRFAVFSLGIYFLDLKNENLKKFLFYGIIFAFLILFADTLYEYLNSTRYYGLKSIYDSRISSFFGDEYIMGSYVVRLLPLLIFSLLWMNIKQYLFYLILFGIFIISGFLIILSGERTAFLLLIIIFTTLILLKKFRIFIFINSILFLGIFYYLVQDKNMNERYFGSLNNFFENKDLIFFTKEHHSLMITSVKIIKSNILIGAGSKSFRYLCKKDEFKNITYPNNDEGQEEIGCSNHPHNIFLQILVEFGLIGVIFFLIIFINVIIRLYININKHNKHELSIYKNINLSKSILYLSLFINIFPLIPSGNFFNNWFSIILYLPVGFILRLEKK